MKGKEIKLLAKMQLDSYINDDSEYTFKAVGMEDKVFLECHAVPTFEIRSDT